MRRLALAVCPEASEGTIVSFGGRSVSAIVAAVSKAGLCMIEQENLKTPLSVLIVDDHDMVAAGLRALLEDEDDIEVIGSVGTVSDAVAAAERHRPDVVLMDYRLPDGSGVDAAKAIQGLADAPGVVMATSVADRRVLGQALDAGCCGFISKNANRLDLLNAVRAGANRDSYFTPDMLKHLVHLRRFDAVEVGQLSDREIEVLQATADGLSPEQIAERLFLSPHTVKNHLRHSMAKLDAHTKLDAVIIAIRARIISIDE